MFKSKDFMLMDVYSVDGKKLGIINDLLLDINNNKIKQFEVASDILFKKAIYIQVEDIVSFNHYMIVKNNIYKSYIPLSKLKNMDVIDKEGCIIGILEDIIFDYCNFDIKGLVISRGFFQNIKYGKKIILQSEYVVGDENIFYYKQNDKLNFVSKFHKLAMEADKDE